MTNDRGTSEPPGGTSGARIDALMELTNELLAPEDRKALVRVSHNQ